MEILFWINLWDYYFYRDSLILIIIIGLYNSLTNDFISIGIKLLSSGV